MGATRWRPDSPAKVILGVLAYEFSSVDRAKSEEAIKRQLRYYRMGAYEQDRVDLLRRLKDSLQVEIERCQGSSYYLGPHGKCAALEDFDVQRMVSDYRKHFPEINVSDMEWFIPFAIYVYYLR